jgi:DNA-binding MarR family transcriptional regulator
MPASSDASGLDRLIHEPHRLALLTVLSSTEEADFVFLQRALRLTNGNLSSHLSKLEDAGLVTVEKSFVGKKPRTRISLTDVGRTRIRDHWEQLDRLKSLAIRPGTGLVETPEVGGSRRGRDT